MKNCEQLSTGKVFLDLCKMYQKWLHKYNELLLPQKEYSKVGDTELKSLCWLINTSDYCSTTTSQVIWIN